MEQGSQRPRIRAVPDYDRTLGPVIIEVAELLGTRLDPWQQDTLVDACGVKVDGRWAANTVGMCVGRQNGKGEILLVREVAGIFVLEEQLLIHSAHEQATSSEHFRRLLQAIESVPDFDRKVLRVSRGKGAEAIELRRGRRILFKTRTGGGARGFAQVDLVVLDEAMILSAIAKSALIPTQAAKSMTGNYQVWYAGSAVDELNPKHDGLEFSRIRAKAIEGEAGIAYFEWSADASEHGDDPGRIPDTFWDDPQTIKAANPSIGIRISWDFVQHERRVELGPREFAVERGGVGSWPDPTGQETVIDMETWRLLGDEQAHMNPDPIVVAFDATPDRAFASIAVAGYRKDGVPHVELADHQRGTGWVPAAVAALKERHGPLAVVCDAAGPAASLLPELATLGIEPVTTSARDLADACGLFFDHVDQQRLSHISERELFSALRGAAKRPMGDAWAWSRKSSDTDISPLVAVTLALWGLNDKTNGKPKPAVRAIDLSAL